MSGRKTATFCLGLKLEGADPVQLIELAQRITDACTIIGDAHGIQVSGLTEADLVRSLEVFRATSGRPDAPPTQPVAEA